MTTINQIYGSSFIDNDIKLYTGSLTALQFPNVPAKIARFKAYSTNGGSIFLGESSADTYFELDAGDDTGWCSLSNLNQLWYRANSGTMDKFAVWLQD